MDLKFVTFVDLPNVGQCEDLRFWIKYFLSICGFADPILLRSYNFHISEFFIFLLKNTYLKCLSNKKFCQTNLKLTFRYFCYKVRDLKKMFNSLCLMVENLRICNLRTGSPIKFADQSKEIYGLAYPKFVDL